MYSQMESTSDEIMEGVNRTNLRRLMMLKKKEESKQRLAEPDVCGALARTVIQIWDMCTFFNCDYDA
jgi:hypothetical protein